MSISRTASRWAGLILATSLVSTTTASSAEHDPRYTAADGSAIGLRAPAGGVTALVFYSTECPIANYYGPTLNALVDQYPGKRLQLIGVCLDPDLTPEAHAAHAKEFGLKYPVIRDPNGRLAAAFGATVTPEAIVLDHAGVVRYRGRIDDQYAARRVKTAVPQTHELHDAIGALLSGQEVAVPTTTAVGCPAPEVAPAERGLTFHRDVAPILQQHCEECHRPGQIGPFPLQTFDQARKRSQDVASVTTDRQMPPWKPTPGFGPAFEHDRSMAPEQVAILAAWAAAGAPEGDPKDAPAPRRFPDDWVLGRPDLVLELPEAIEIPATGEDLYRCLVIPTNLPADVYIAGIEYRPGNPRAVHHVLGYIDTSGEARRLDAAEAGPGYTCFGGPRIQPTSDLGGWAPGTEASWLPDGIGRRLPAGGDVVLQVHYHPSGKSETDRTRVGLYFARKPVQRAFHWAMAGTEAIRLDPDHPETWELGSDPKLPIALPIPVDVDVIALAPHMHRLGKRMTMWAEVPRAGGQPPERIDLIQIKAWDFQWQNQYYLRRPIRLPQGSVIRMTASYDYSRTNPRNPHRDRPVMPVIGYGEATTDEMCLGFVGLVKAEQDLTRPGEPDDLPQLLEAAARGR